MNKNGIKSEYRAAFTVQLKKFSQAELYGRAKFNRIMLHDFKIKDYKIIYSPNPYDAKDCTIFTKNKIYLVEIKYRYQSSTEFYDDIIETQKYSELLRQKRQFERIYKKKVEIIYCIIYNDDGMYRIYDLSQKIYDQEYRHKTLFMSKTTSKKSGKIEKNIIYLYPFDKHTLKSYRYPKKVKNNNIKKFYRC